MAEPGQTQTEHDLFLEQAQSKTMEPEKQKRIAQINVERQASVGSDYINASDRIKELLKKQGVAGTAGNPPLTPDEMKEIAEYNLNQMTKKRS